LVYRFLFFIFNSIYKTINMATVNKIVYQLADAVGKPFDNPLRQRIKDLIAIGFEKYIRLEISRHGIQDNYITEYDIELEEVPSRPNCENGDGCMIMRSKNVIVTPIPYRSSEPFISVSNYNGTKVLIKAIKEANKHQKFARFGHSTLQYRIEHNKLIVIGDNVPTRLTLRGIYPSNITLPSLCPDGVSCRPEDVELPINGEYITAMKKDILAELGLVIPQDSDVPVTKDAVQQ